MSAPLPPPPPPLAKQQSARLQFFHTVQNNLKRCQNQIASKNTITLNDISNCLQTFQHCHFSKKSFSHFLPESQAQQFFESAVTKLELTTVEGAFIDVSLEIKAAVKLEYQVENTFTPVSHQFEVHSIHFHLKPKSKPSGADSTPWKDATMKKIAGTMHVSTEDTTTLQEAAQKFLAFTEDDKLLFEEKKCRYPAQLKKGTSLMPALFHGLRLSPDLHKRLPLFDSIHSDSLSEDTEVRHEYPALHYNDSTGTWYAPDSNVHCEVPVSATNITGDQVPLMLKYMETVAGRKMWMQFSPPSPIESTILELIAEYSFLRFSVTNRNPQRKSKEGPILRKTLPEMQLLLLSHLGKLRLTGAGTNPYLHLLKVAPFLLDECAVEYECKVGGSIKSGTVDSYGFYGIVRIYYWPGRIEKQYDFFSVEAAMHFQDNSTACLLDFVFHLETSEILRYCETKDEWTKDVDYWYTQHTRTLPMLNHLKTFLVPLCNVQELHGVNIKYLKPSFNLWKKVMKVDLGDGHLLTLDLNSGFAVLVLGSNAKSFKFLIKRRINRGLFNKKEMAYTDLDIRFGN